MNEHEQAAEAFYGGAPGRIVRYTEVLAVVVTVGVLIAFGVVPAAGFVVGAIIAWWNFRALSKTVEQLASRIVDEGSRESGRKLVVRFLLRYVLVGAAAYAIFKLSRASLVGLFAGLCLPVAAVGCEAAYELYVALRRGL